MVSSCEALLRSALPTSSTYWRHSMGISTKFAIDHSMVARKTAPETEKSQRQRFKEAARELGCNDSEEAFDEALRKAARQTPKAEKPPRSPKSKG